MMLITVVGESRTRWVVDERVDATISRRGRSFIGWEEGNEERRVWVQRVLGGSEDDDFRDDRRHLRRAYEVGQLEEIRSCTAIRQVLDLAEQFNTYLIQELADAALDDVVKEGPLPLEERWQLRRNLGDGLKAIHRVGLVHSDVQTSNLLRVAGVWKLADLGGATTVGTAIDWLPVDRRFVLPSIAEDRIAIPEMDWFGAGQVMRDAGASDDELDAPPPATS